ncbi:MAG TPA: GNAT family N-acetyltransferase [Thermoanaerobaculia bacterium]|nr:GNAT family N-acetyltransferase [Thermoanaerobaculia bacterium]
MEIREATADDAAKLAALSIQLGYSTTVEDVAGRLRALRERPDNAVFVAEEDGTVAGWLHVSGMLFLESPTFAEVAGLVVDEARRGQGVGKRLVEAAARWAVSHGYRNLRVRSNVIREDAHRFYEREGFRRVKSQVVLDLKLQD